MGTGPGSLSLPGDADCVAALSPGMNSVAKFKRRFQVMALFQGFLDDLGQSCCPEEPHVSRNAAVNLLLKGDLLTLRAKTS